MKCIEKFCLSMHLICFSIILYLLYFNNQIYYKNKDMGYYIFGKAIDVDTLSAVFGSKDETLYKNLTGKLAADCDGQDFEDYNNYKALHTILFGETYIQDYAHMYGYAVIEICNYIGKDLPYTQELKLYYETDLVNKYLKESFDVNIIFEDYLFVDGDTNFLNLPKIKDWPIIGIIQKDRLEELYNILKPINIEPNIIEELWDAEDDEDEDKACAYEAIMGWKKNLEFCLDQKLSLAVFCH